jgi:hypothetical protein
MKSAPYAQLYRAARLKTGAAARLSRNQSAGVRENRSILRGVKRENCNNSV